MRNDLVRAPMPSAPNRRTRGAEFFAAARLTRSVAQVQPNGKRPFRRHRRMIAGRHGSLDAPRRDADWVAKRSESVLANCPDQRLKGAIPLMATSR